MMIGEHLQKHFLQWWNKTSKLPQYFALITAFYASDNVDPVGHENLWDGSSSPTVTRNPKACLDGLLLPLVAAEVWHIAACFSAWDSSSLRFIGYYDRRKLSLKLLQSYAESKGPSGECMFASWNNVRNVTTVWNWCRACQLCECVEF